MVQVIVYATPRPPSAVRNLYYGRNDSEQPPVIETNTHFIGRFTPTVLNRTGVRLYSRTDSEQPPVSETQPHFIGKFTPLTPRVNIALRQIPDNEPPTGETNVHFLGHFSPTAFNRLNASLYTRMDSELPININCSMAIAEQSDTDLMGLSVYNTPTKGTVGVTEIRRIGAIASIHSS